MFVKYYLIEIRSVNGTEDIFNHYLCTAKGKPEIADIIVNFDRDTQWQVINCVRLTKSDYIKFQKYFDNKGNNNV